MYHAYTIVPPLESAIIGSGSQYFWNIFQQFKIHNTDIEEFAPTWNWSAFILGGFWFTYRKVYFWGAILIPSQIFLGALSYVFGLFSQTEILSFISSLLNIMISIAVGVSANYLYYSFIKAKTKKIKAAALSEEEALRIAQQIGGINIWVTWIAVPITIIFFLQVAFGLLELIRIYVEGKRSSSGSSL